LPEFDILPTAGNNGVIGTAANPSILDLNNNRAPSLRDLVNNRGTLNGPFMHNGSLSTLRMVIDHYNLVPQNPQNTNIDPRLAGPGGNLQLTNQQKDALEAFLRTLTSTAIYTDTRWSDPFNEDGTLALVTQLKNPQNNHLSMQVYPNPAHDEIQLNLPNGKYQVEILSISGNVLLKTELPENGKLDISSLPTGALFIVAMDNRTGALASRQIQKMR
jgi:cytochrome c peroxidase